MSYQIHYPPVRKLRGRDRTRIRLPLLTLMSFSLCCLLVMLCWSEGSAFLRRTLPAAAVLDHFAADLLNGDAVLETVSDLLKMFLHDPV